ncbi:Type I restriction modification system, N-6 DNA Methylase [Tenacibaculum litoreum]|uniref:restriction endonuclease subunit S n=1 Tax=Tenacibaculum litoreum TaxID=321269 RepID=UPI0038938190
MLKGHEISEVLLSDLEFSGRLDSEYYKPSFLKYEELVKSKKNLSLKNLSNFLIGPFGSAFTVDNYVQEANYRYIRGKDVKPLKIRDNDNVYMPKEDYERLSKYSLKENDILVSVVGTIGNAALVTKKDLPAIFSCKSTVLRPNKINSVYLLTYINTKYGKDLLLRKERGAIQKGLNLGDLETLDVFLPSNSFQLVIENIFRTSIEKTAQSKQTYTQAENLLLKEIGLQDFTPSKEPVNIKSFKDSFATSGRLDAEYYQPFYEEVENIIKRNGFTLLQDICSDINYGTVPTSPYTKTDDGIPYIKGMNLKNTEIKKDKLDRLVNTEQLPDKYFTKKGDIIISQMGTVGDVGVIRNEENWLFASFTIRARLSNFKLFNPSFVGLYIQKVAKKYYLYRNIAQASVRQNTDLPTIRGLYLPNIDIEKQNVVAELIEQSFSLKKQSEHLLEVAKKAVEIAIEENEEVAIAYINNQSNSNG